MNLFFFSFLGVHLYDVAHNNLSYIFMILQMLVVFIATTQELAYYDFMILWTGNFWRQIISQVEGVI